MGMRVQIGFQFHGAIFIASLLISFPASGKYVWLRSLVRGTEAVKSEMSGFWGYFFTAPCFITCLLFPDSTLSYLHFLVYLYISIAPSSTWLNIFRQLPLFSYLWDRTGKYGFAKRCGRYIDSSLETGVRCAKYYAAES
jgi:hypothetical protein